MGKQNYLKGNEVRISISVHGGKDMKLGVIDVEKNSIYRHNFIIKEVEQDQVLTKDEELEDKGFEERLPIKDDIIEEVFE